MNVSHLLQVLLLTFINVFSFADGYLLLSGCTVEQPSPGCLRTGKYWQRQCERHFPSSHMHSSVCSALQRLPSYWGEFPVVIGAGDFSDSTKTYLDTAGNGDRQKLSHPPVSFQEEKQSSLLQNKHTSLCLLGVWGMAGSSFATRASHSPAALTDTSHQVTLKPSPPDRIAPSAWAALRAWVGLLRWQWGQCLSHSTQNRVSDTSEGKVPTNPSVRLNTRITWQLYTSRGVSLHCQLSEWFTK